MAAARRASLGTGGRFSVPLCWIQPVTRASHHLGPSPNPSLPVHTPPILPQNRPCGTPAGTPDPFRPVNDTTLDLLPVHSAPWLFNLRPLRRPDIDRTRPPHTAHTRPSPHTCLVVSYVRGQTRTSMRRSATGRRPETDGSLIGWPRLAEGRSNPKNGLQGGSTGSRKEETLVAGMIAQASSSDPPPPRSAALSATPRRGK